MEKTTSVITSKYQTTVPKAIRTKLKLSVSDILSWEIEDGQVLVRATNNNFLAYKSKIKVGTGDLQDDVELARKRKLEKYR